MSRTRAPTRARFLQLPKRRPPPLPPRALTSERPPAPRRMRGDVSAQRTNPQRERTVKLLDEIRSMAKRALKRRAAAAGAQ